MAEVTTVERVTRHPARYQPQATSLKAEVSELQNALLNNRYYAVEEINQARTHFEGCTCNYEAEAREIRDVEVAHAVAPIAPSFITLKGMKWQ